MYNFVSNLVSNISFLSVRDICVEVMYVRMYVCSLWEVDIKVFVFLVAAEFHTLIIFTRLVKEITSLITNIILTVRLGYFSIHLSPSHQIEVK